MYLPIIAVRSEEHTSELQSRENLVCRLLLEKKKKEKLAVCYKKHHLIKAVRTIRYVISMFYLIVVTYHCIPSTPTPVLQGLLLFFFNDTATTEIYTLSLHDALPI